ncbi:HAMP domain-containing histidine kinase [Vallitalea pronyensis]|uniref:Heme sensor protein HssS n=1 Tax=Vallitalea pronyensis TaxID=1348613 RepID=A0A8J8MGT6_9FIRM|nr:HAMP domain-containing sensor histidine kinase [Vallitalea pronyensis]QUI21232.1 HAMP domain-containing histidine kinase [Vallitalea pronyensis]
MIKRLINSIYTRFLVIFISALFLANIASVITVYYTSVDDIRNLIQQELANKVDQLHFLMEEKNMSLTESKKYIKGVRIEPLSDMEMKSEQLRQEGVFFTEGKMIRPYYIVKINDAYLKISPTDANAVMNQFRSFLSIFFGNIMFIGSLFIIIGIAMIVRPLKKIAHGIKDVANGNFNVKLKKRGHDEIAQLTDNFNKMVDELNGNEYLRKDFVSSISHEFKTPITSIKGFAKMLNNPSLSQEEKKDYIDIIISESERLSNLSANLLKLSELDSRAIINKTAFSLDEQLRRVILLFQEKWERKNIQLHIDLDQVTMVGDEDLLYQVWVNIISNAIKFTKNGGTIEISLKHEDNIKVIITDSGIGIKDADKEQIFERFFKGDKSRSKEGTGLGLSIVKKILKLHDSHISIESEYGKGSSFCVEFTQP